MAKKGNRILIKLRSESGYSYYTTKNKMTHPDKLTFKKYDPNVRAKVLFTEGGKFK